MHAPTLRIALFMFLLALTSACSRELPVPKAAEALSRPTTTTVIRNGRVLAPENALTVHGGTPGVFVITDGVARFRMVRTGKRENGRIEILSGLAGTERLVTGDLLAVHDGSTITTVQAEQ